MQLKQLSTSLSHLLHTLKQNQAINQTDLTIFLHQLATLISAGIPIIQSCEILEKSQLKIAMRLLIYSLKREMLSGKNLFQSMQQHSHYFDVFTCQLVQIGEHTGRLDHLLTIIATQQEKNLAFQNRIKRALFYPCIITVFALIVTFSMFILVIPRFADLFRDAQIQLPALTQWLFLFSTTLKENLIYLFITFACLCLFCCSKQAISLKKYMRKIILNFPPINQFIYKISLTRFARNLAITLSAGIPILDALKLTASVVNNQAFANITTSLRHKISAGMQLYYAMATFPYFPALMVQMVQVGEESGKLEHMLNKIADFIEADVDQLISHYHQLLEPLIMLVLGVLIGGLVIGMYLPIFRLGSVL